MFAEGFCKRCKGLNMRNALPPDVCSAPAASDLNNHNNADTIVCRPYNGIVCGSQGSASAYHHVG